MMRKILCNIDLSSVTPQVIIKQLRFLNLLKLIWMKTIHNWKKNGAEIQFLGVHIYMDDFDPTAHLMSICATPLQRDDLWLL